MAKCIQPKSIVFQTYYQKVKIIFFDGFRWKNPAIRAEIYVRWKEVYRVYFSSGRDFEHVVLQHMLEA